MHRAKTLTRWHAFAAGIAHLAGVIAREVGKAASDIVGLGGAALVAFGLGQVYAPLLPITAGAFLLLIGRQLR